MKKLTKTALLLAVAWSGLLAAGCVKDPEQTTRTQNPEFEVATLFTHEGCTVFRFSDAGRYHYFTNCQGETRGAYSQACGKGCVSTEYDTIQTTVGR